MAYKDLREFIEVLEGKGLLKRIKASVDCELEITEITDRVSKSLGPALLFEKVRGYDMPVLINAFGTEEMMNLSLKINSVDALAEEVADILETKTPQSLLEKIKLIPKLRELNSWFPKTVRSGPCKEVIIRENPSLKIFPVLKSWPLDAGKFITLATAFMKDPETGVRNCGIYRMQIYDDKTTGMHWHIHKVGASIMRKYKERGIRMPVAACIGTDPAVTFSAITPMPDLIDEMILAGFIRKKAVEMVKCETIDLEVPANSEIVLEGYVDPDELRLEGPFGDHTGLYSLPENFPVFHLTCITHRKNPIYQTIIVGRPPMEDCHMGAVIEKLFLPLIKKQFPEVVDMHMPFEGVFHNLLIVSIRKHYPGHARKMMHALWGMGQAMYTKAIIVVDEDVDIRDLSNLTWKVLNNIDPERDTEFVMGPTETLDHASRSFTYGSKMGIDGTRKWKEEGFNREWPEESRMTPEIAELVKKRWKEYGF